MALENGSILNVVYDNKVFGNTIDPTEWNNNFKEIEDKDNANVGKFNSNFNKLSNNTGSSEIGSPAIIGLGETADSNVYAQLLLATSAIIDRYTKTQVDGFRANDADKYIANISLNANKDLVITWGDNDTQTIALDLEKIPASFGFSPDGKKLVITNQDGTKYETDITSLLNLYSFNDSSTVDFVEDGYNITATIKAGSIVDSMLDSNLITTLQNLVTSASASATSAISAKTSAESARDVAISSKDIAVNAQQSATASANTALTASTNASTKASEASTSANNASTSANNASAFATNAKSWAIGTTNTRTGENTDNAKYYAQQAQKTVAGGNTMLTLVYDTDKSGVVDNAEKLNGELPSYYDNQPVTQSTELINIDKTQTFDYLGCIYNGNSTITKATLVFTATTIITTGVDFTGFNVGDIVTITGCTINTSNNKVATITAVASKTLTFASGTFTAGTETGYAKIVSSTKTYSIAVSSDNQQYEVSVGGVNLFDGIMEQGNITDTGVLTAGTTNIRSVNYTEVSSKALCCLSAIGTFTSKFVACYDKDKNFISRLATSSNFTAPDNCYFVKFVYYHTSNITPASITNIQLNYGTTALPYVPYRSFKVQKSGKNLLNITSISRSVGVNYVFNNDGTLTVVNNNAGSIANAIILTNKIPFGTYTLNNISGQDLYIQRAGSSDYSTLLNVGSSKTFTYSSTDSILRLQFVNFTTNTTYTLKLQLELGSVATTYSAYIGTEYTVTLKDTLGNYLEPKRKLPNGVADMVFKDVNGLRKKKANTKEYTLQASDIVGITTTPSNIDYAVTVPLDNKNEQSSASSIVNTTFISSKTEVPNAVLVYNDVKYIGSYANRGDGKLLFVLQKGTTLAQAQTALAGTKIIYQLKDPVVTTLHADAQTTLNEAEKLLDGQTVIYGSDSVSPSFDVEYYKGAKSSESANMLGDKPPSYYLSDNYTAKIGTTWSGTVAPFTQTITVTGLTANDEPIIDIVTSDVYATAYSENKAWGNIIDITTGTDTLTIRSKKATTVPLNIKIKVVR